MLLGVEKMTCGHCVRSVTSAVHGLDPQASVDVSLADGTVRIAGSITVAEAARVIGDEGYSVRVIET